MAFMFMPDRDAMVQAGLGSFASTPFLLSADLEYLDAPNRYLRERTQSKWRPTGRPGSAFAGMKSLSENTLLAYCRDIENFSTYLEGQGLTLANFEYLDVVAYRDAMQSGSWSEDARCLSQETVKRRIDVVVDLLTWAADRGLRSALHSDQDKLAGSSPLRRGMAGSELSQVFRRNSNGGPRRPDPKRLRLPTTTEVSLWLSALNSSGGPVKALAAETIIKTGMRLEEVTLLRTSQLPEPDLVDGVEARMEICYGTKGERRVGDPDKKGKPRAIRVDPEFLYRLIIYRDTVRPLALKQFRQGNPRAALPLQLFLSESTGKPISSASLYKAWHTSPNLPFPGWSPHLGRHTYACFKLLRLLVDEFNLISNAMSALPRSTVLNHAGNLIDVYIRPAMGHLDRSTTERYLGWLADHVFVKRSAGGWANYLEGDQDA